MSKDDFEIIYRVLLYAINFREIPIIEMPNEDKELIRPKSSQVKNI